MTLRDIIPAPAWTRVASAAAGVAGAEAVATSYARDLDRIARARHVTDPAAAAQATEAVLAKLKRSREAVAEAREALRLAELDALRAAAIPLATRYADQVAALVSTRDALAALDRLLVSRGAPPLVPLDFFDESLSCPAPVPAPLPGDDLNPPRLFARGISMEAKCLAAELAARGPGGSGRRAR